MQFFSLLILTWLRFVAQLQLSKYHPKIIGVTGSTGKSSCVRAIAIVLSEKYNVKYTKKGNSETGIPFEILDIPVETYIGFSWLKVCLLALFQLLTNWEKYNIFVVEMGIDSDKSPKNMEYLLSILKPDIGVLLSITGVHAQNFAGSDLLQSIANEKGKLLTTLSTTGTAIYSKDYSQISPLLSQIKAKKVSFSSEEKSADMSLKKHTVSLDGTTFEFNYKEKSYSLNFPKQIHFKESFGTFASALIIADKFKIPIENACDSLSKKYTLPPGRMSMIEGINESTILDSSYNSSLGPTSAALKMMGSFSGRKIAVLGDMRELGSLAEHDHQELAKIAAKYANFIIFIGPLTHQYALPVLKKLKFPEKNVWSYTTAYEAIPLLSRLIKKGDLILVKGSQNTIFLEIIVKAVMKHPEQANVLLARQTPFWEKERTKLKI